MAYSEELADRIRDHLEGDPAIEEKKMFGGLSFLLNGNMSVGVIGDELCVRVGAESHEEALSEPGARKMDFTGRPMKGWVMVGSAGFPDDKGLKAWIDRGVGFASKLPPK